MPSLWDPSWLAGSGVLVGLICTATLIVLIADWRLALFALAIQYLLLAALLTSFVQPSVAAVRILSGGLAVAILYLTMHQRAVEILAARRAALESEEPVPLPSLPPVFVVGWSFRLFAVALVVVVIVGFSASVNFLGLPPYLLFGSLWLMAIGVLLAILARDVLHLGLGILVFSGGFGILDTAIEASLLLYGMLSIADLLIALVIAHLATLPSRPGERRGENAPL